ncbi:translocation/assembly module TamB domain-containing protein [Henriciella aquimarina]|uniref:translocation/assembly module TamB domain-containing protein n=1 Tax=Henriciella aquimarina TaxID=545261 RepID=UPI000A0497A0|nr:translocation/assembly module TamB domain-containing protein [Henriciella aquimarina]
MTDTGEQQTARKRRPLVKWGLIALAGLVGLLVVILLALRFAAQSSIGRNFVEARIEAADPSGQDIEIEGLSGDLLGTFRIERLTVADEDGIWLEAENVLADWKPLALRKRSLWVEALEADLIHVMRRPVLVSSGQSSSGSGTMPLRAGKIETLRIGEVRTDEGVLPRPLSLEINGQGRLGRDGGRTELAVLPLEGDGDRLTADLTWSEDFRVRGNLALDGPAGGLFASLARLQPGQSLNARLDADGTLETWQADGEIAVSEQSLISIDAQSENETIAFNIDAHPARHPLTARIADTLGDELTIDGAILREDGSQPVLDLDARAEGLNLEARARQDRSGVYSADLRLRADRPDRYAGSDSISVGSALLDGTAVYDAGSVRFDGTIEADAVDVPSFAAETVSGPLKAVYDQGQVLVNTTLTGEGATLPGMAGKLAGAAPVVSTNLSYDLSERALAMRELSVRGKAARISAAGTATLQQPLGAELAGSFQLDGAAAGLARPVKANGQFKASRTGDRRTTFETRINASNLGELPRPVSDWSDGQARITANGELMADGALKLSAVTAETGTLRLDGSGRLSADQILSVTADLEAGEAGVAGATLSGLTGRATINGPVDNLRFETQLNAPAITRSPLSFENVRLASDGRYRQGVVSANTTLDADTETGPLSARTGLTLDGAAWQVEGFEGEWGDLVAAANLSANGGKLSTLRGNLDVNGELPAGLPARSIEATGQVEGEQLTLDATLATVALGPAQADALVVRATGTPEAINFVVDMDGRTELNELNYETSVDLDGEVKGLSSGAPDLTASLSALLGDISLTTQEPIRFVQHEDGFEASARFAALDGTLAPQLTTRGETRLQLEAQDLRIAPLLILAGREALTGAMDISVDFRETEGGLAGPLRAELSSVARPETEIGPIDLFLDGQLQPQRLDLQLRAQDSDILDALINTEVPVTTSASAPFITRDPSGDIPFNATLDGQIEAVAALVVPPQMVLKGLVEGQVSGRLPNLNDSFEGQMALSEGVFEHGDLGMVLQDIRAQTTLGGGSVTLESLEARGRSGGTLSGSGSMAIDGSARSDVELTADKLVVTERREGSATVSGTMSMNQKPDLLEVTGDLTVDEGKINIDKLPDGGPPTLDVSFTQPQDGTSEDEEEQEEAATRLDISLTAPDQINVSGRGANAELALDAEITGSFGNPVITGQASVVRGRFDLLGKRFRFTDSTVRLAQELGQSRLDISAVHDAKDDITAILNVTGTIDRPDISLTSDPVLPEDEVLSRVLFGRSPTQLSALETARLAAALAQLSGGGGFDLLGGLEQALGLDTFDLGSGSSGDVQVTSGKYLTEDVYLEVRSGAAGAPGVAIEWEPLSNIEVEAATSTEDGQQLSVQWKRDFD